MFSKRALVALLLFSASGSAGATPPAHDDVLGLIQENSEIGKELVGALGVALKETRDKDEQELAMRLLTLREQCYERHIHLQSLSKLWEVAGRLDDAEMKKAVELTYSLRSEGSRHRIKKNLKTIDEVVTKSKSKELVEGGRKMSDNLKQEIELWGGEGELPENGGATSRVVLPSGN